MTGEEVVIEKTDILAMTEPAHAFIRFNASFSGAVTPGLYPAIIQCREHAGHDHGYYLAAGMMVNEHTFTILLELDDYGKTFECILPRGARVKLPECGELESVRAGLEADGEHELAARISSAANVISQEASGRLADAALELQKVSEELLNRDLDEPAIRLKAVIARFIDSSGRVTLDGADVMRKQLDELLRELESVVNRLRLRADEFYSMMRFDDPHMIHVEEFYDKLYTGFIWEAEVYGLFDALEALKRFGAHRKDMT